MAIRKWIIGITSIAVATTVLVATAVSRGKQDKPRMELISTLGSLSIPEDQRELTKKASDLKKLVAGLRSSKPYIVIDTHSNHLYLRTEDSVLINAICSTGSGGELVDSASGRKWHFETPTGTFKVQSKLVDPWWRKPDWAFVEENLPIPEDPRERYDPEMLGEYALGFGDGYFIHGTIYERLLGISVTHGCVRVGSEDLKRLYEKVKIGTEIYVF
jgi:L,D-transpeptidase YbiS